ncbi:MAG: ATP-binding protein [Chloroflexi bacterium AL-W]|nr:ATP-binding protein [Chloroflexi bacterium AL-N1]NOK67396.1 ATP-binding protein [Chloroflexi bacterium AL-N10]NOK75112.1 ATP-binding protein [Chloroflexi bacterium AL-N5]NOK81899.1 ATP-binding protein [Chloroflexi bacterium AL-W]NOK89745.1 ATP-binding protein [Chloroflexi bacterium AL-N15]
MNTPIELTPEQLRRTVDPQTIDLHTEERSATFEGIIGQQRAVAALRFGLGMGDNGFNIYIAGPPGLGKMTAVRSFIEELVRSKPKPPDICYVNNFLDPSEPTVCFLSAGLGHQLRHDMQQLITHMRREVPKAFEGDEYNARREEIMKTINEQREALLEKVKERAAKVGFLIQGTPIGILLTPVVDGRPLSESEFQALPSATQQELMLQRDALQGELKEVMQRNRTLDRQAQAQLKELDQQIVLYLVGGIMDDLLEKYRDLPEITEYFQAVRQDMLEHVDSFKDSSSPSDSEGMSTNLWPRDVLFRKYQVNVLVDHSKDEGAPVVVDLNPSYPNLFGRIEKETQFGTLTTDFTLIKGGSLHKANGGYLVLQIEDVLRSPFSWEALKRALRSHEIQIVEVGEQLGIISTKSLRPQPIALDIKIVLIGPPLLYYLLHTYDEVFPELFKIKADFDIDMAWNAENQHAFIQFARTFCQKSQLKEIDTGAIAKLLEQSARLAADQHRLSTRFGILTDIMREAHFWAAEDEASGIHATHICKAIDERTYRSGLIQQRAQDLIAQGTLLIDTMGERVGQINGLSVMGLSDYAFGRPSRITASVGPGRGDVIDIEREVQLGGPLHSKGVLILNGYLTQTYAQDQPLRLSARLVFEQNYAAVEGDSASSAELYALLSALSGVPIKQGIAVTGSVNQHGDVQAIGGINEKIEGFFDICLIKGLTGDQGVLIPYANLPHLMLREDVIEAVRTKQFHIWAVKTINEGIELLTGVPACTHRFDGFFSHGSINDRINQRLREFATYTQRSTDTESQTSVLV